MQNFNLKHHWQCTRKTQYQRANSFTAPTKYVLKLDSIVQSAIAANPEFILDIT